MSNSPWGQIDNVISVTRGVSFVSTPGHGGFRISQHFAMKNLSINALQRSEVIGSYRFFEEDCDYAIVAWELFGFHGNRGAAWYGEEVWNQGELQSIEVPGLGKFERSTLLKVLSTYHADYLRERGVEPDAEGLAIFEARKLRDKLAAEKSQDLIVSAVGDWHRDCPDGYVLVTTADDSRWLVKAHEYDERNGELTLLSTFTFSLYQGRNGEPTLNDIRKEDLLAEGLEALADIERDDDGGAQ